MGELLLPVGDRFVSPILRLKNRPDFPRGPVAAR
jgi:hypothetical protein